MHLVHNESCSVLVKATPNRAASRELQQSCLKLTMLNATVFGTSGRMWRRARVRADFFCSHKATPSSRLRLTTTPRDTQRTVLSHSGLELVSWGLESASGFMTSLILLLLLTRTIIFCRYIMLHCVDHFSVSFFRYLLSWRIWPPPKLKPSMYRKNIHSIIVLHPHHHQHLFSTSKLKIQLLYLFVDRT